MQSRLDTALSLTPEEKDILLEFFPKGICAFDLEMTGLSPIMDKIIEIASLKLMPNGDIETFHRLINPLIPIPEHTIQYHKLTNDKLRDCPSLKNPLKEFIQFYDNIPLLAHNAMFDASFLIRGIHEFHYPISLSSIYDSCKFGRGLYKKEEEKPENFKLSTLANYFKIEFSHHQALDDAIVCLKVFANCLKAHKELRPEINIKADAFLFKLNSFKSPENYILPNKLKEIKHFIENKTPFYIKYKGGSFKGKYRKISAISLLPLPQGLVLYALCLESNMNKYFYIRKVQSCSLVNKDEN